MVNLSIQHSLFTLQIRNKILYVVAEKPVKSVFDGLFMYNNIPLFNK